MKAAVFAAALLAGFASNAFADSIIITGHSDYRTGPGGEFNVRASAGSTLLDSALGAYVGALTDVAGTADGTRMKADAAAVIGFQTFCLEYGEHISLNTTYDATIGTAAVNGGDNGAAPDGTGDPLSIGTAFLYSQFAAGTLSGYVYGNGPGRAAAATELQNAFWYLENERSLAQIGPNIFVNLAFSTFGGVLGVNETNVRANNTTYNVGILNLTPVGQPNVQSQSQLIMRPVPDGGLTLMMLGMGLSGLAVLRRRIR